MNRAAVIAAAAGLGALVLWQQRQAVQPQDQAEQLQEVEQGGEVAQESDWLHDFGGFNLAAAADTVADAAATVNPWAYVQGTTAAQDAADSNVRAFLAMIAAAEGTTRAADPYRVCYSYRHTIADLSNHPAITGEWTGESLENLGPAYAGKISTAAGRYQIIKPTWQAARRALALPDFGPDSQDAAAVWLIDRKPGALDAVKAGDLTTAVGLCASTWASLPGAGAGQPERRMAWLQDAYTNAGGLLA